LGAHAVIEGSIIGERVSVGDNAVAQNAVLGTGTQISAYSRC
jgi:NDP-sugar pyrophosphorylase family protein